MSEVNHGATVPEVTALPTNQGSGVSQGSLGTRSDGLWDGLFCGTQGGRAGRSVSFIKS